MFGRMVAVTCPECGKVGITTKDANQGMFTSVIHETEPGRPSEATISGMCTFAFTPTYDLLPR